MSETDLTADQQVWDFIKAEQAEFGTLARHLSPEQWAAPSLCQEWTVRDVIVHTAGHTHGNEKGPNERERRRSLTNEELVDWLAEPVKTLRRLPRFDAQVQLAELMIHQQDVRRPLCLTRPIPPERIVAVLQFGLTRLGSVATAGLRKHTKGLRLEATDIRWAYGDGLLVTGPAEAILVALGGRVEAVADLAGEGLERLSKNVSPRTFRFGPDRHTPAIRRRDSNHQRR